MEENLANNPEPELPLQELATETPAEEIVTPEPDPENPDNGEAEAESQDEEVEYSGNKYKVPKELAPIIAKAESLQADYTRKTQEAAEERKANAAERELIQHEARINHEIINDLSQLRAVESELKQYDNVNWQQWYASNSQEAGAGQARYLQLQNAHRQIHGQVEARKSEIAANYEQRAATVLSQATEILNKPDPKLGWDGKFDEARRASLRTFALAQGITESQVDNTTDPVSIKILNLAMMQARSLEKQKSAVKPPPGPEAKPVPIIGVGRTRITSDPEKMSQEQYNAWRKTQGKAR